MSELQKFVDQYFGSFWPGDMNAIRNIGDGSGCSFPRLMLIFQAIECIGALVNERGFQTKPSENFVRGWKTLFTTPPETAYGFDLYQTIRNGLAHTFVMKGAVELNYWDRDARLPAFRIVRASRPSFLRRTAAKLARIKLPLATPKSGKMLQINLYSLEDQVISHVAKFVREVNGTGSILGEPRDNVEECFEKMRDEYRASARKVTGW